MISIIMPTYNNARYLSEAIDSILNQTFTDFEFIIVNDHSIDETAAILARYAYQDTRIHVIENNKNLGVARTLNRGIGIAQGEYIARMDSDDISLPDRFEKQVVFLDANPDVGVLGTQTLFIDENGQFCEQMTWEKPATHNRLVWQLLSATPFCHPSIMMRACCLRKAGGYDPDYPNEDMQLWTRMVFSTKLANLGDTLLYYRMSYETHVKKLLFWEEHIQRVSREFVERLLHRRVDQKLIRIFFYFQKYKEYFEPDLTLPDIFGVCRMLQDTFDAMKSQDILELDDLEAVENLVLHQTQDLVSTAFERLVF